MLGREPVPMHADYDRGVADHDIDLLYEDTAMVGLIECIPQPGQLFVENIAVAPDHQGPIIRDGVWAAGCPAMPSCGRRRQTCRNSAC